MIRDVKTTSELVKAYEEAIEELGDEDRLVINTWLKAVEIAVSDRRKRQFTFAKSNFGRAAAIELLDIKLSGLERNT